MLRPKHANRRVLLINATLLVMAVGILSVSFTDVGKRLWFPQFYDPGVRETLSKPLRLQVRQPDDFAEFLLALRTFHYRAQPRGIAVYADVFYDTEDWRLYRNGYSYRFRQRRDGGSVDYAVRLEREPRFVTDGSQKTDLRDVLPVALGDAIVRGAWEMALSQDAGLAATVRLGTVLQELGIAPEDLRPRLSADLRRERFDITDKGRSWFELDHEIWSFRPTEDPGRRVEFEDIVIDTRLERRDPELIRRVKTIQRLSGITRGVRPADGVPHERAVQRLGLEAES